MAGVVAAAISASAVIAFQIMPSPVRGRVAAGTKLGLRVRYVNARMNHTPGRSFCPNGRVSDVSGPLREARKPEPVPPASSFSQFKP